MVKTKVRFDGLDVAAMVAHWNRVALGRRVINIYNGPNGDTYLFKLDKNHNNQTTTATTESSSGDSNDSNMMLLLESGIRFHTTEQPYENPGMPSPFCSKLRKHLRGLRLESVAQLGNKDRVIHLVFGSGETQRHSLILELYARGNLLLTNANYTILALLRSHDYANNNVNVKDNDNANANTKADTKDKDKDKVDNSVVKVQVGHAYPVTYATTLVGTTTAMSGELATTGHNNKNDDEDKDLTLLTASNPMQWYQQREPAPTTTTTKSNKKKKGGDGNNPWRTLLLKPDSGVSHYGPSLMDHCLLHAKIDNKKQTPTTLDEAGWNQLQQTLQIEGGRLLHNLDTIDNAKGYILYQPKDEIKNTDNDNANDEQGNKKPKVPINIFADKILLEFQPHLLQQHQTSDWLKSLQYESFDAAVDAFFSHIEGQKQMLRVETQQAQAQQRLEKIKLDQQQRVQSLLEQELVLKQQAEVVALHADMVDKALQVVNSALDSGMDWDQLQDLVQLEQIQNQNPVALLIHKLQLDQDSMILRLETTVESTSPTMDVTISLKDTAHGNASALFAKYRANKEKSQKTMEASAKALQAAEINAQRQLLEAQNRKVQFFSSHGTQTKRKALWFEKFHWFITSDNYLVIAGRDAQQNEQLVKRYLRPGDAYLHADVHGAASCVLRAKRKRRRDNTNKTQALPLSDQALREAGNFTICRSSAWSSRMVTSAWWVESHQVSKTAPTGEYLTVGSFMIRGKKNFLPPTPLEMGLGVLFLLGDDEALARHKNERRDFALMQLEDDEVEIEDEAEAENERVGATAKVEELKSAALKTIEQMPPMKEQLLTKSEMTEDVQKEDIVLSESEQEGEPAQEAEAVASLPENVESQEKAEENGDSSQTKVENEEPPEDEVKPVPPPKEKKGLSARDRKLIKKYGSLEAAQESEGERKRAEEQRKTKAKAEPQNIPRPVQQTQKRGKKAKMKRMAQKYADQDDEDRELAMMALHAGEKDKRNDKKKAPEISETEKEAAAQTMAILKKDSTLAAEQLPEQVRETLAKCITVKNSASDGGETIVRWDKFDADVLEQLQAFELDEQKVAAANRLFGLKESSRIDNFSASLAGIIRTIRKYGHKGLQKDVNGNGEDGKRKTKAEKEAENQSWKKTLAEEGVLDDELEDDAVDDTTELSKLTGKPHNDDLILFAVPVCAPYQTLSQYAYRVKLTPGNMKRGKASKGCVEMFNKDGQKSALSDRNKDLIKKVVDNEWVQAICGDVKISAAGASKAIQKQKSKNKNNRNKKKK